MAAGTCTYALTDQQTRRQPYKKLVASWTSDAAGAVNGFQSASLNGKLKQVSFVPDAVDTPTTLYDVVIVTEEGVDILGGLGANLVVTGPVTVAPRVFTVDTAGTPAQHPQDVLLVGKLEVRVTNAGDAKKGKIVMLFE